MTNYLVCKTILNSILFFSVSIFVFRLLSIHGSHFGYCYNKTLNVFVINKKGRYFYIIQLKWTVTERRTTDKKSNVPWQIVQYGDSSCTVGSGLVHIWIAHMFLRLKSKHIFFLFQFQCVMILNILVIDFQFYFDHKKCLKELC